MPEIDVTRTGAESFRVEVRDGRGKSVHEVKATAEQVRRYGGGASAESLIEASFEFLLEREPKESILSSFDLPVIERYFPEYAGDVRERLA